MIQSPCRTCPNRHMDKRLCSISCAVLNHVQVYLASRMQPSPLSAVNSQDEGRYHLMGVDDTYRFHVDDSCR